MSYSNLAAQVQELSKQHKLFVTNAEIDPEVMVRLTEAEYGNEYNCSCCKAFIRMMGNVAYVNDDFEIVPLVWALEVPDDGFKPVFEHYANVVRQSAIVDVWVRPQGDRNLGSKKKASAAVGKKRVGFKESGGFNHLYVKIEDSALVMSGDRPIRFKAMLDVVTNFKSRYKGLKGMLKHMDVLHQLMDNSKKVSTGHTGQLAEMIQDVRLLDEISDKVRSTATAVAYLMANRNPFPLFHLHNTPMGSAIKSLDDGIDTGVVTRQMEAQYGIDVYRRRTRDTSPLELSLAAELFKKHECYSALKRRLCTMEDMSTERMLVWKPESQEAKEENVFLAKAAEKEEAPKLLHLPEPGRATLRDFVEKVLPTAKSIKITKAGAPFRFSTPIDSDAKPLMIWDTDEDRQPICGMINTSVNPTTVIQDFTVDVITVAPWTTQDLESKWIHSNPDLIVGVEVEVDAGDVGRGVTPWFSNDRFYSDHNVGYSTALRSELYEVRGAVDTCVGDLPLEVPEKTILGFQLTRVEVLVETETTSQLWTVES